MSEKEKIDNQGFVAWKRWGQSSYHLVNSPQHHPSRNHILGPLVGRSLQFFWFFSKIKGNMHKIPRDVAKGVWGVSHPHILHLWAFRRHFRKFHRRSSHGKKIKNLWRRKCVRRSIFRNIEVRAEGRFVPFNPYFVWNTAIGSLCDNFYRKSYDFSIKNR